jgi:branched-chain amino acid transport system ATP-binding protein
VLRTEALTKEFRGFRAVDGVDLRIREGSVHALVGPNGAGKTTLFNLLTGFLKPSSGRIVLAGQDLTGKRPEQVARLGVARSFQITSLFPQLTPQQHVELALQSSTGLGWRFWRSENQLGRFAERARHLLDEVGLGEHAEIPAGRLAYGRKRALEIATTLAMEPELMLLDEPTQGMGHEDVHRVAELIKRVSVGRTILMVEHNMSVVSTIADTITVLQRGAVLAEGTYEQVSSDPLVMEAYMGTTDGQLTGAH